MASRYARRSEFIGRQLTEWTLPELKQCQASRRKPSPKVQLVIDALEAEKVDQVSLLSQDVLDYLYKETTTEFASIESVLRAVKGTSSPRQEGDGPVRNPPKEREYDSRQPKRVTRGARAVR